MRSSIARFVGISLLAWAGVAMAEIAASAVELGCWWCEEALTSVAHTSFAIATGAVVVMGALLAFRRGASLVTGADFAITARLVLSVQLPTFVAVQLVRWAGSEVLSVRHALLHLVLQILAAILLARSTAVVTKLVRTIRAIPRAIPRSRGTGPEPSLSKDPFSSLEPLLVSRPLRAPPSIASSV